MPNGSLSLHSHGQGCQTGTRGLAVLGRTAAFNNVIENRRSKTQTLELAAIGMDPFEPSGAIVSVVAALQARTGGFKNANSGLSGDRKSN